MAGEAAGAARESPIAVYGLKEINKAFREMDKSAGPKRLVAAYAEVSTAVAARATAAAQRGTPLQEKMARAIRGSARQSGAGLSVMSMYRKRPKIQGPTLPGQKKLGHMTHLDSGGAFAAAFVAFWGTDRQRLGWFAQGRYDAYTRADQNLSPWVGSSWGPAWAAGNFSEGPYALREGVAESMPTIEDRFLKAILQAGRDVGFEVSG